MKRPKAIKAWALVNKRGRIVRTYWNNIPTAAWASKSGATDHRDGWGDEEYRVIRVLVVPIRGAK